MMTPQITSRKKNSPAVGTVLEKMGWSITETNAGQKTRGSYPRVIGFVAAAHANLPVATTHLSITALVRLEYVPAFMLIR